MGSESQSPHLGDHALSAKSFATLDSELQALKKELAPLSLLERNQKVSEVLLRLIQQTKAPTFLLPAVVSFVERIQKEGIHSSYSFTSFEFWLNHDAKLSFEENREVRGKIIGKWVPREAYQNMFPIGMDKVHSGSHYVTAHNPPDLDTTIASFWGWVDAFGARVGKGLHVWNVPGGMPPDQIEIEFLFYKLFGESVFSQLAKARTTLSLTSIDLLTQKGVEKKFPKDSMFSVDLDSSLQAVILTDDEGHYLGEWRNMDVEGARQVIMLLNQCLRWLENQLHVKLIALFTKEPLFASDLPRYIEMSFNVPIEAAAPYMEFTETQKERIAHYLTDVIGVERGVKGTFLELSKAFAKMGKGEFISFIDEVKNLEKSSLFGKGGELVENRRVIFEHLAGILSSLDRALAQIRSFVDRFEIAFNVKEKVFGYKPQVMSDRADVEEIRAKMGTYSYLTVGHSDPSGKSIPLGIVRASDLHKEVLGTVSLRDFSNREETKVPPYFEIISVIDHHKSRLSTSTPAITLIADAQSANVLVAELAFQINDAYGMGGMTLAEIGTQIRSLSVETPAEGRIMRRLLQKKIVAEQEGGYFVDPEREYAEYLHFLYAIFDDTDLLTKVTYRDITCVASLINRMKSILLKKEVEVIQFDDLARGSDFVTHAAERILQHEETYSLYRRIYEHKEKAVEQNIKLTASGKESALFDDTKEQNGCARVGQTKMFSGNFAIYHKNDQKIRSAWIKMCMANYKQRDDIDLYLQMISTVACAEDLYTGNKKPYLHKDELWIFVPESEQGLRHLQTFLSRLSKLAPMQSEHVEIHFLEEGLGLEQVVKESMPHVPTRIAKENLPMVIIFFEAGTLNSRKTMISPFLPKDVSRK